MSTADSFINTASVLFIHDIAPFLQPSLNDKNKLLLAKVFTLIIGILVLLLVLYKKDTWQQFLLVRSFYLPVVPVPFVMAVFGFRPRELSVLLGMGAGFLTTISFNYFGFKIAVTNRIIISLLMHLLFLISSHYLLPKIPNTGWIGIKEKATLLFVQQTRRKMLRKWIYAVKKNIFWTAPIIYRSYGLYIFLSHCISALFAQNLSYSICYIMAILWLYYGSIFYKIFF